MPITIQWDTEAHTVIRWEMVGTWTWEDFYAAVAETRNLRAAEVARQPIVNILDMTKNTTKPLGMVMHGRNAMQVRTNPADQVIFVTTNQFMQTMINSFRMVYRELGRNVHIVSTLDEARIQADLLKSQMPLGDVK